MAKTVKIYHEMPVSEQKKWLSDTQVLIAYVKYFRTKEDLNKIDKSKLVQKKHFLVQSEEYKYHLKNETGDFNGIKWDVKILYSHDDIAKNIDEEFFEKLEFDRYQIQNSRVEDLRSHLNDRRSVSEGDKIAPVVFYGDEKDALCHNTTGNEFRMYYGIFMNKPFIDYMFCRLYDIKQIKLDAIVYLFMFKFFTKTEFFGFSRSKSYFGKSGGAFFQLLIDEGYIEPVDYKMSSLYRKQIKKEWKQKMYTTTDKCDKLVTLYMDYIMYKRKIDYIGVSHSDTVTNLYDTQNPSPNHKRRTPVQYEVYCAVYDYINYYSEVALVDDENFDFFKKMSSADFVFNPIVNKVAESHLLRTSGRDYNKRYIENMLSNSRWGIKL